MVAGDGQGIGAEVEQARYLGVYFLYHRGLSVEVSVLASGVGRLDVDKEEVVVVPVRLQRLELTGDAVAFFEELHAGQAGQALVHRVAGDGGGGEVVGLVEGGEGGVHSEAAYQDRVRGVLVGQDLVGLIHEGVGDSCTLPRFLRPVRRLDGERFEAGALGVGVGEGVGEAFAPEDGDGPVLFLVHHEDLDAFYLQVLVQELDELFALLRWDAAGAAVRDLAFLVPGREVHAGGQVVLPEIEADAQSTKHAASDLEAHGIVAEEGEVPGTAARAHTRRHGTRETKVRVRGQGVEVRGLGGLQLRVARWVQRESSQPVQDEQDYLRVRLD